MREISRHTLGVVCGLGAGVWLGAAEVPTKLVNAGLSPFTISFCMVLGVFTARWSFPTLLKGTRSIAADLLAKKHLIVWALLAGALWAVANTLTVYAVRDVGLAVAFPLWNANSLFGLLWGRLLFGELRGVSRSTLLRVVLGTCVIVFAAWLLGSSTIHSGGTAGRHAGQGIAAALGASLLWGTMYIPYRKAYISGMNPLSFVTAFTLGELGTMLALVFALDGGTRAAVFHPAQLRPVLFWLFLGGFAWVIGDLLQQFAAKYLGIGRAIPISNTNQLWGLAWAALAFGELKHATGGERAMVTAGSLLMIAGAVSIGTAAAQGRELASTHQALKRECDRYGMDYRRVLAEYSGTEWDARSRKRSPWDYAIVAAAVGIFIILAVDAAPPALAMDLRWTWALGVVLAAALGVCGWLLYKTTRFS